MSISEKNSYLKEIEDLKTDNIYMKSYIKKLEKQIDEANDALKKAKEKALSVDLSGLNSYNRQKMYDIMFCEGIIDSYLDKWGVK